jgi:hypothetical protein
LNDAPWFSSITFERDSSPSLGEFHSELSSDQQFFDVANEKQLIEPQACFAPDSSFSDGAKTFRALPW